MATLKLPYFNEVTSRKFKDAVRNSGLQIKIVEKPGRKLKDSRPLDKKKCITTDCRTCTALSSGDCTSQNVVYHIKCNTDNCSEDYGGRLIGL